MPSLSDAATIQIVRGTVSRFVAENPSLLDQAVRLMLAFRSSTESPTASDSPTRSQILFRGASESLTATDVATQGLGGDPASATILMRPQDLAILGISEQDIARAMILQANRAIVSVPAIGATTVRDSGGWTGEVH